MEQWELSVVEWRNNGMSWRELALELLKQYPEETAGLGEMQARTKARNAILKAERHARGLKPSGPPQIKRIPIPMPCAVPASKPAESPDTNEALMDALSKGADAQSLATLLGVTPRVAEAMVQDAQEQGYNVQDSGGVYKLAKLAVPAENRVVEPWRGERIIRFGLMGDTQLGCFDTQITHLHALYDFYKREGIETVYHTGDLTDGEKMRPGHEYELYVHGADAQVAHAVKVYPRREGIRTRLITGNHDYSFVKSIGLDIGRQVAAQRDDMEYLGFMAAVVELSPHCTLELRHPQDGTSYAISYKIQKMVDAMSGGEKPNVLAVGHYHKKEDLTYRNVQVYQTACLCAQTHFLRGINVSITMGGWLVELHVDDEGSITRVKNEFMPFYKAIKGDYKNWL